MAHTLFYVLEYMNKRTKLPVFSFLVIHEYKTYET